MPRNIMNDETGVEETFYSPAELEAAKKADADAFAERETNYKTEIEKRDKVLAEKTENFKRLRDMTEQEKEKLTAAEIEARKIAEAAEDRAKAVEDLYKTDTEKRADAAKRSTIAKLSGGNAEIAKKMEDSWAIINMPGTDDETIAARGAAVFNMVTGGTHNPNPLTQPFGGESPAQIAAKKDEEFYKSEKGQAALKAMGIAEAPKTEPTK